MTTWNIDAAHSEVTFKIRHLMVSSVRGKFNKLSGSVTTSADDFAEAKVSMEIDASSVDTNNEQRDGHLKSADFFQVTSFPTITFSSTSFAKKGDGYELKGNMMLHGVTKPVVFSVAMNGINKGMDGARVAGFEAHTKISRKDFGLTWNAALEAGGVALSDEVSIELLIELKETK